MLYRIGPKKGEGFTFILLTPKKTSSSPRASDLPNIHRLHLEVPHFSEFAKTPKADVVQQEVIVLTLTTENEEPGVWSVCCCFASCCHLVTLLTIRPTQFTKDGDDDGPERTAAMNLGGGRGPSLRSASAQ